MEILEDWHRDILNEMSDKHNDPSADYVCECCGIPWKDGVGFVGKHVFPCANAHHGWNFVRKVQTE